MNVLSVEFPESSSIFADGGMVPRKMRKCNVCDRTRTLCRMAKAGLRFRVLNS